MAVQIKIKTLTSAYKELYTTLMSLYEFMEADSMIGGGEFYGREAIANEELVVTLQEGLEYIGSAIRSAQKFNRLNKKPKRKSGRVSKQFL